MGHLLSEEGLRPDPEKVRAIIDMTNPKYKKGMQRLLGFINYLAKLLPHLSDICEPLRRLSDRESIWTWQPQHEDVMQQIKKLVTEQPVLRYFDTDDPVTLQCDASEAGLGATLLQNGQPIAFASRSLSQIEQRYAQIEKECLAVIYACEKYDQYILGRETVTIESDHKPLENIFKKPLLAAPKRLQRMLLRLQKYNLNVTYKRGAEMYIADMLSRTSLPETEASSRTQEYEVFNIRREAKVTRKIEAVNHTEFLRVSDQRLRQIQDQTAQDATLQLLKATILAGWPETKEEVLVAIRKYWSYCDELTVQNGILFKGPRVIIPKTMRPEMRARVHSSHQGIEACLRKARDVLYWPNMRNDIRDTVSQCATCNEYQTKQAKEPLMTHEIPERPWSRVETDIFTLQGENYLVLVDYYSDFWEVDHLANMTAVNVIQHCKANFSRYGIPDVLVSDNAGTFGSDEFNDFATEWEFEHATSSPYHSQSNGRSESPVKIAKKLLKKNKRDGQDMWKAILDWRNTPSEGMESSPVQRLMSRRTHTPLPTATKLLAPQVIEGVPEKIKLKRKKAKLYHDRKTKELPELKVGERVRVQPIHPKEMGRWKLGTCTGKVAPRSYTVDIQGRLYRRNRKFLRTTKEDETLAEQMSQTIAEPPDIESEGAPSTAHSTQPQDTAIPQEDTKSSPPETLKTPQSIEANEPEKSAPPIQTRTRTIKAPARYEDFVLSS